MKIHTKILLIILPPMFALTAVLWSINYGVSTGGLSSMAETLLEHRREETQFMISTLWLDLQTQEANNPEAAVKEAQADALYNIRTLAIQEDAMAMVIDANGRIIAHTSPQMVDRQVAQTEWFQQMNQKHEGQMSFAMEEKSFEGSYFYFRPWDWYIVLGDERSDLYAPLNKAGRYSLALGIMGAGGLTLLLAFALHHTLQPIRRLADGMERIQSGDFTHRINVNSNDELGKMAQAFNRMAVDLDRTLKGLRTEIVDRRAAEETLRHSENRFRQLAENIQEGFWITAVQADTLLYVSPAYARIFDYTVEDFYTRPNLWRDSLHPEDRDRVLEAEKEYIETGNFDMEYRIIRRDGQVRWVRARGTPILNENGRIYRLAGIIEDITERRQEMHMLWQTQKLESLGVLAGGIAHDFNNLLTGILAQSSLVLHKLEENHPVRAHVQKVIRAGESAATLTQQLLAYAGQKQAPAEQTFDLNRLLQNNLDLWHMAIPQHVHLFLSLSDKPLIVYSDPVQFQQIVMNLIINAAEAIPDTQNGRIQITTKTINHTAESSPPHENKNGLASGLYILMEVKDNGRGIPRHHQDRIFDPFFTTKSDGHGLGLSAVLGIIQRHNGSIQLKSLPECGTTFRILLPPAEQSPTAPTTSDHNADNDTS